MPADHARRDPDHRIPPGTAIANGRYALGNHVRVGPFADVYDAVASGNGAPVSIHIVHREIASQPGATAAIAAAAERAAGLSHTHIARLLEIASQGQPFVVTELIEGDTLRALLARKSATSGGGFAATAAINIIAHVLAALDCAHARLAHGALGPDAIAISRSGHLRLIDFGLAAALPHAAHAGLLPDAHWVAPEVVAGGPVTPSADLFSAGALLYHILTGQPAAAGAAAASTQVPGIPTAVDDLIAHLTAADPRHRFASAADAQRAVASLGQGTAPAPRRPAPRAQPAPAPRPSLAESLAAPSAPAPASPSPSAAQRAEAHAASLANDTEEKWLVSQGKLDYGPFSLAQLVDRIRTDKLVAGDIVIDKDTGQRTAVEHHPLLGELVDAAAEKRRFRQRASAEMTQQKRERSRGKMLIAVIGVVIVALVGGGILVVNALSHSDEDSHIADMTVEEKGSVQAKISFPAATRHRSHHRSGKGHGKTLGYDDSMDMDMADEGGGSERLAPSDINPVIQQHGGALARCMTRTGSHHAFIEIIIQGSGKVSDVRVNSKTSGGL
ncbi:MAG TPA: protein kinase, partial [Kofleriaceae bacterium]|nr:protein kinase [Kofleriaceae bacterium]